MINTFDTTNKIHRLHHQMLITTRNFQPKKSTCPSGINLSQFTSSFKFAICRRMHLRIFFLLNHFLDQGRKLKVRFYNLSHLKKNFFLYHPHFSKNFPSHFSCSIWKKRKIFPVATTSSPKQWLIKKKLKKLYIEMFFK